MKSFNMMAVCFAASVAGAGTANAQAADWEGFYAGGSISSYSSEDNILGAEASGAAAGAYAGYNLAVGPSFVVGGEIDITLGSRAFDIVPTSEIGKDQSLRIRAGYATNQVLVYGLAGKARATLLDGGTNYGGSGTIIGLGGEYKFSPNLSGRLEFTKTNYDSWDAGLLPGLEFDTRMITLGVSYHF